MEHPSKLHLKKVVCFLLAAGMLSGLAGCGKEAEPVMAEETKSIAVKTHTPETGSLTLNTEFIGTVEPDELVSVFPKVGGTVLNTYFNVGDSIKKGDLLFEIDPIDIQLQVNIAKAAVDTTQAAMDQALGSSFDIQLAQLENQVRAAQNGYSSSRQRLRDYNDGEEDTLDDLANKRDQATNYRKSLEAKSEEANAKYEAEKTKLDGMDKSDPSYADQKQAVETLREQKTLYGNQLSEAETNSSLLDANYNELDDDDSGTRKDLRTAQRTAELSYETANKIFAITKDDVFRDTTKTYEAQLNQALAAYNSSAQQLQYTKVYSPIDGVIEERNVQSQGQTSAGDAAYTVSNKSIITVVFYVPADAVEQMRMGDKVTVENGRRTYDGAITEVGSMVDAQTGLFKVKASVNVDDGTLLTGLTVKISAVTAKAEESILIPQSIVYYESGEAYVYVYENDTAVKTMIKTGVANEEEVEVLSGLTKESKVISSWNPNLKDGAQVTLTTETTSSTADPAASGEASSEAIQPLNVASSSTASVADDTASSSTASQEG